MSLAPSINERTGHATGTNDTRRDLPVLAPKPWNMPLTLGDIPHMAAPVAQFLHEVQPDAVIAADRGARLFGLAVYRSWKHLYPEERFPTVDGKLHFQKFPDLEATRSRYADVVNFALTRAGILTPGDQADKPREWQSKTVVLLDDWICQGTSVKQFKKGVQNAGAEHDVDLDVVVATMCGEARSKLTGEIVVDFVGNPARKGWNATWNNNSMVHGIKYLSDKKPIVLRAVTARRTRRKLHRKVKNYFRIVNLLDRIRK